MEYAVTMKATEKTYEYLVYRIHDDNTFDMVSIDFKAAHDRFPAYIGNNVDAMVVLQAHAAELFED